MLLNEPIAKLRTLSTTLLAADGVTLLPLGTSWLAGMVKVSRNGGAFVDAVNLPVAVTGGGDGAFDHEIALAEIATPGTIRVRFFDALGDLIAEFGDDVIATPDPFIELNETSLDARTFDASLVTTDGDPLPAATVWSAGMVKVSKAGGAFANAANLPTNAGDDGAFRFALGLTEVDTVGNVRVRFYTALGVLIGEYVKQVRDTFVAPGLATTEALAHEAILQRWQTGWHELHVPDSDSEVKWTATNEKFDSEDEWVRVAIVPALSRQSALGAVKRWTRSGIIGVQIFTRASGGTLRASELADDVRTVLEGQFILAAGDEPVVTYAGASGSPQANGKWYLLLVTIPYSFDQLR